MRLLRERRAGRLHDVDAGFLHVPVERRPDGAGGRFEHSPGRLGQLGSGAVTGNQGHAVRGHNNSPGLVDPPARLSEGRRLLSRVLPTASRRSTAMATASAGQHDDVGLPAAYDERPGRTRPQQQPQRRRRRQPGGDDVEPDPQLVHASPRRSPAATTRRRRAAGRGAAAAAGSPARSPAPWPGLGHGPGRSRVGAGPLRRRAPARTARRPPGRPAPPARARGRW